MGTVPGAWSAILTHALRRLHPPAGTAARKGPAHARDTPTAGSRDAGVKQATPTAPTAAARGPLTRATRRPRARETPA